MDAATVKKIGKYEITGILGRGGMGVVYRAEDKRIGRLVAIKTLTEGYSGQPEMLERFYREAQAGILQHPNIVIVYDLGDQDGVPFIVMEHVTGDPLDRIITSGRQLPLIDKLSIIEQVCGALGYAHQQGVVHRDIKPANVIVQPDGHAKIVDFGIARVQSSNAETGLTRTGNVIGTIHYIAPERLKGLPFDGRSDIFSTGVMLYLLLAGQLPFAGEDVTVLQKLVNEPHPPLKTYLAEYPPFLDAILDRALAKDPEQRYATAEEFAADLRSVSEDLKKGRVSELFNDAERLTTEQQFGRAREVLQQLIKIDSQHTGARQLLGIVQQNLARMQRAEQVRQLVAEAEEALASKRFPEALASLDQAVKLDTTNTDLQGKLEAAREQKRRYDEIASLLAEAEASRSRGDLTGALKVLEKALQLDQENTKVRAAYAAIAKQAQLATQQGQIREMLDNARQEVSSRHFTAAIEILNQASKLDPSLPELESLLQAAINGQEQERRRKLLEQVQSQVESSLLADEYDRAADLVSRAIEQLPSEASLLQLKTRVDGQARKFRARQLIDSTAREAQEAFSSSPHEALLIVQRALQELPGEERLLALEDSLRQRLKGLETEEVRKRYLREAQEAIGRSEFEAAVEILESYRLEFADASDVNELLEYAKGELAQRQRDARIASCTAQAKSLMQEQRIDEAMRVLEPVAAETRDPSLARLLTEAREQQAAAARKLEVLANRVKELRERGRLDEAIALLKSEGAGKTKETQVQALLNVLVAERDQKQVITRAIATARQAVEQRNFAPGWDALESTRQAYGDSPELMRAQQEFQAERAAFAQESVGKSIDAARAALLNKEPQTAQTALSGTVELVEFSTPTQQTDWRRIRKEAEDALRRIGKPATGSVRLPGEADVVEAPSGSRKILVWGIAAAVAAVLVITVVLWLKKPASPPPAPPTPTEAYIEVAKAPSGAAVSIDNAAPVQTDASGKASVTVKPGLHQLVVSKDGFEPFTDSIQVNAGETYVDNVALRVSPPPDVSGRLRTQGNVPEFKVFVDGVSQGTFRAGSPITLAEGKHKVKYAATGFEDSQEKTINIVRKKDTNDRFSLTRSAAPPLPSSPTGGASIISFFATPPSIQQGSSDQATLQWTTKDAVSTSIDPGGTVASNGQLLVKPSSTTTYTLTAKGKDGQARTQQTVVAVTSAPPPKLPASIAAFSVNPSSIQPGEQATLQWDTRDAVSVSISPDPGSVAPKGQISVRPSATTTFTLIATGSNEQPVTQHQTVTVTAPTVPTAPTVASPDDKALLQDVLRNFQSALDAHDIGKIQAIWAGKQSRDFQTFFKNNPEATVKDDCPASSLVLAGETAQWTCTETITIKSGGRIQPPSSHTIRFSFAKKNGTWSIADRR